MRVHLRNVVYSAVERGVVMGQHRVGKLSKHKQKDIDLVVDTLMKSIWESLDDVMDFTDGSDEQDDPSERPSQIGFHTDAVSGDVLPDQDDDEDEEDKMTRETLHRVHRRK